MKKYRFIELTFGEKEELQSLLCEKFEKEFSHVKKVLNAYESLAILTRDIIGKQSLYSRFGEEYILSEEEKRIMSKFREFEREMSNLDPFFKRLYSWCVGEDEEIVLTDIFNYEYKVVNKVVNIDEIYQVVQKFIDEIISSDEDFDYYWDLD